MPQFMISISTYIKSDGLSALLESLLEHSYDEVARVHIADDNSGARYKLNREDHSAHPIWAKPGYEKMKEVEMPGAIDVYSKYKKEFKSGLALSYDDRRGGVAINKNRGIHYFLEKCKEAQYLCLMDDDIVVLRPGMLEEFAETLALNTSNDPITGRTSLSHLTTTWSDAPGNEFYDVLKNQAWSVSREGWHKIFPVEALGEKIEYRRGAMGCCCYYTRKCIEDVGYMDHLGSKYGLEHSVFSSKCMLKADRRSPVLFPIYDYSELWIRGQGVPNAYSGTEREVELAEEGYQRRMAEIGAGFKLKTKFADSGLDLETLTTLE